MDHPGNPMAEGSGTAARGIAEMMAVLFMAAQYYRQTQEAIRASELNRHMQRSAELERYRQREASQWRLGLDKGFMRTAATDEVIHVWAKALPWTQEDVRAMQAKRLAEARLEQLDPELMRRYRRLLDEGSAELPAMWEARQLPGKAPGPGRDRPVELVSVAGELSAAPEVWEAGPRPVAGLPQARPLALEAGSAWPMGPAGSTEVGEQLGETSPRERLAAVASTTNGNERPSFTASQADIDRGKGETLRAGAPIGQQPISRPIVAGPGAGLAAVRGRSR
jgi:hypothetical protein